MSRATSIVERFTFGRRALVFAALAMASLGGTAPVAAQDAADETVGERLKEYWAKAVAKMESGARATGDEYHKVREEAAKASGPARAWSGSRPNSTRTTRSSPSTSKPT
jgi:hypothetical protein